MPSPVRISYAGAYYHIIMRGNNKSVVFTEDEDFQQYLLFFGECLTEFELVVYAYALMTNHIHIFLKTMKPNLSEFMMKLNLEYTKYFNKKYHRSGHLFETRFKSKLVQKDKYFLALIRYIHLNPVKAGIVSDPANYKWSSYNNYLNIKSEIITDTNEVLNYFSSNINEAKIRYKEFINMPVPDKEWEILDKVRNGILGDYNFRRTKR
jgi:REP element-mobilizing transposase RayT